MIDKKHRPIKPLKYASKGDLTTGNVGRHLVRLTTPMVWGIFAIISVQIADTYFIGLLGTKKLAAISFTFPITMILTHLLFGLNISMASVVSRLIGGGEMDTVRRVVLHGLLLAFISAGVIASAFYILHDPIFRLMGADDEMLGIIRDYMPLWLAGLAFLAIPSMGNSAMRAGGDSLTPALIMTLIAGINLMLDPILIFGKFGFPEMGVTGAALATITAYVIGLMAGLYVLIVRKNLIIPRAGLYLETLKDSIKRLAFIAIPAGITNIIMPTTTAVIIALLSSFGAQTVAAYGIASRIEAFAMIAMISLGTAMAPVIGQNFGAVKFARVHKTINLSIGFNFVWSFTMATILFVFGRAIAGAFSDDVNVVNITALYLSIVPVSYVFGNLVFGWASTFNAVGRPERAFFMIVVKSFIFMIPAIYIGRMLGGLTGIFIAIAAVNFVAGGLFHILSRRACARLEMQYADAQN